MDPETSAAVIGALVGAVVAGAITYSAGWLQEVRHRERKRRSLATIMLADLRTLDVSARGLFDASPGFIPPNAFRSLALITEALECFSPQTVSALVDVTDRLDGLRSYLERLVTGAFPRSPMSDAMIRGLVVVLLDRIVILKTSLHIEGGTYHPFVRPLIPDGLGPGSTSLPPLPPSSFPDVRYALAESASDHELDPGLVDP
jgi:hypothetical protein